MQYLPLITIPLIYFLVAMVKPYFRTRLPFNPCAICIAVSTTWALLLILWLLKMAVSPIVIAILMGMSVAGLMYKSEGIYIKFRLKNFWLVRLIIIIGGFYAIYFLLNGEWFYFSFLILISLIGLIITTFLFQGITHEEAAREIKKKSTIIHKLDNCC